MKVAIVLGISMRSGTNYLHDLLVKHPQCSGAREIWEDYVLADLQYVSKYFSVLDRFWAKFPFERSKIQSSKVAVGSAIANLLLSQETEKPDAAYLITKTPSFLGLERAPDYFPEANFFLLIRDGRSVAFSLEKSFGVNYFEALERWRNGARELLAFRDAHPTFFARQCRLVSYEDVFRQPRRELTSMFEHLGLNPEEYDFAEADELEIRGSSDLRDGGEGSVHWQKMERTKDFNPIDRYKAWPRWKQQYARDYLCSEMEALGYTMDPVARSPLLGIPTAMHTLGRLSPAKLSRRLKQWIKAQLLQEPLESA